MVPNSCWSRLDSTQEHLEGFFGDRAVVKQRAGDNGADAACVAYGQHVDRSVYLQPAEAMPWQWRRWQAPATAGAVQSSHLSEPIARLPEIPLYHTTARLLLARLLLARLLGPCGKLQLQLLSDPAPASLVASRCAVTESLLLRDS